MVAPYVVFASVIGVIGRLFLRISDCILTTNRDSFPVPDTYSRYQSDTDYAMPPTRVGPKGRKGSGKKGWPSKTRSYPWRTGSSRPAEALKGVKLSVKKAPSVHRFTRWGSTCVINCVTTMGVVQTPTVTGTDSGVTVPITLGAAVVSLPVNTGLSFGGGVEFTMNDLPLITDFTALFDHYTIEQVDIELDLLQNNAGVAAAGASQVMPTITYVPDFDDSAAPTAASEINEYQRAKVWTFRGAGKPLKFSIKPRTAMTVFRTGITNAYAAGAQDTSVNLTYTDVPHYGLKFWIDNFEADNGTAGAGNQLRWKAKYHLKFLDPR